MQLLIIWELLMKDSNIFTVDQVAARLDLHPKTVRRFIREGKLKACKIGKQWRINERDLRDLLGDHQTAGPEADEDKAVEVPINRECETANLKIQVSAVVDIWVADTEEAVRISNTLFAVMNCKDPSYGDSRCNHIFYKDESKARYLLWGSPRFIGNILECIAVVAGDKT
jgi:excisionase family DNA binding protein